MCLHHLLWVLIRLLISSWKKLDDRPVANRAPQAPG